MVAELSDDCFLRLDVRLDVRLDGGISAALSAGGQDGGALVFVGPNCFEQLFSRYTYESHKHPVLLSCIYRVNISTLWVSQSLSRSMCVFFTLPLTTTQRRRKPR